MRFRLISFTYVMIDVFKLFVKWFIILSVMWLSKVLLVVVVTIVEHIPLLVIVMFHM